MATQTQVRSEPRAQAGVELVVLDALRGLAAAYVMLGHARWLLWSGYGEYTAQPHTSVGLSLVVLASAVRYGHAAVLVFFLISGFCIHYRQAQAAALGRSVDFDVGGYAMRRTYRLLPPLLLALALTRLFDLIGEWINPSFYAGQSPYPLINDILQSGSHSLSTFVGNIAFQSTFAVPAFGTDSPLWSLAYEFWFYVLYPLALLAIIRTGVKRAVAGVAVVSILATSVSFSAVPWWVISVLAHWIMWIGGAVIAEGYARRRSLRGLGNGLMLSVALLFLGCLMLDYPIRLDGTVGDLAWGLCLAIVLGNLMLGTPPKIARHIEGVAGRLAPLGRISYSLYIVHFPWLALITAWWLSSHPNLPLGPELAIIGAMSAFGLAVVCWFAVERRCSRTRAVARHPSLAVLVRVES